MKRVTFTSRLFAQDMREPHYVISIRCPGQKVEFKREHKAVLALEFDDVEDYVNNEYILFDFQHCDKILSFIEKVPDNELLVVHCEAGISRSAAVAKFLQGIGWRLEKKHGSNGKLDLANGRVYGMLRSIHYDRTKKPA